MEEIKTTCFFCNRKAVFNLKHVDGRACVDGPAVQLGAEERYFPACYECYGSELGKAGRGFPGEAAMDLAEKLGGEAGGDDPAEVSFD